MYACRFACIYVCTHAELSLLQCHWYYWRVILCLLFLFKCPVLRVIHCLNIVQIQKQLNCYLFVSYSIVCLHVNCFCLTYYQPEQWHTNLPPWNVIVPFRHLCFAQIGKEVNGYLLRCPILSPSRSPLFLNSITSLKMTYQPLFCTLSYSVSISAFVQISK